MFEGHSADTCARKFQLKLMGGRAEVIACADPGAMTPIGDSGIFHHFSLLLLLFSWSLTTVPKTTEGHIVGF